MWGGRGDGQVRVGDDEPAREGRGFCRSVCAARPSLSFRGARLTAAPLTDPFVLRSKAGPVLKLAPAVGKPKPVDQSPRRPFWAGHPQERMEGGRAGQKAERGCPTRRSGEVGPLLSAHVCPREVKDTEPPPAHHTPPARARRSRQPTSTPSTALPLPLAAHASSLPSLVPFPPLALPAGRSSGRRGPGAGPTGRWGGGQAWVLWFGRCGRVLCGERKVCFGRQCRLYARACRMEFCFFPVGRPRPASPKQGARKRSPTRPLIHPPRHALVCVQRLRGHHQKGKEREKEERRGLA